MVAAGDRPLLTVVARNVLLLTAEKASHLTGALISLLLVARTLGPERLADFGFAVSVTAFFIPLIDVGLNTRVIKASAAPTGSTQSSLRDAIAYRLAVGPAVFGLMMGCGLVWGRSPDVQIAVLLIGMSTISMSLGDTANAVFKGLQRAGYSLGLIGGLNVLLLILLSVVLSRGGGLIHVGACFMVARTVYMVVAFGLARYAAGIPLPWARPSLTPAVVRDGLLHMPAAYFLGNALYAAYMATYVVLGEQMAGTYYVGYRAAAAVFVLVSAGFEAVLAAASAGAGGGEARGGMGTVFALLSIGGAVGLYAAAPVTPVLFGAVYAESITAVRVLAWCVPPFAFVGLAHTILLAQDRQRRASLLMVILLAATTAFSVAAAWVMGPLTTATVPMFAAVLISTAFWLQLKKRPRSGHGMPLFS